MILTNWEGEGENKLEIILTIHLTAKILSNQHNQNNIAKTRERNKNSEPKHTSAAEWVRF